MYLKIMAWKSVCFFSKIWRLTCHINSGATLIHRSEENGGQQNQPKQKKTWFFQNRDHVSLKPSCVWEGKSFQTTPGWQISPSLCDFLCASRSLEKMFLLFFSFGWFIRTQLSDMKHIQHHPTTSQVLPQAQLSDFSCPALTAVLCANWCCLPHKNGYVTVWHMWMKFMHCIFSLMLIISTCGTVCLDSDLGEHKSLYTSF